MPPRTLSSALRSLLALGCIVIAPLLTSCNRASSSDTQKSAEQAIRALDAAWSKAAGAHDLDATLAFYADNAVLLPPDEPAAMDKAAIRASWSATLHALESLSWEVTRIEVARSGELAYLTGKWKDTVKTQDGMIISSTGKLLEVWGRQSDGTWKCVADTYNDDTPTAAGSGQ
jgi:ketosteroid isomerase-like protein